MHRLTWIVACAAGFTAPIFASPPPIEAFARMPAMRGVTISPDGSRIAFIAGNGDSSIAVATELATAESKGLVTSDPGQFDLSWCNWANDRRLLCGFSGMATEGGRVYPVSRLVAVNADGSDMKVLIQNGPAGVAQFQDRVLDWTPDEPDTVLIELDDDGNLFPSVFELNVYTGQRKLRLREHEPIRSFTTDAKGNIRLGTGFSGANIYYFTRLEKEREWRRLAKFKAFSADDSLEPIAIAGADKAYAVGSFEGREALWEMDLSDQSDPQLVFSHPLVDAARPLFTGNGRLLGIRYELDRPFIHYTNEQVRSLIQAVNKLRPGNFNLIADASRDEKIFVVLSYSDVDDGTYYLLDATAGKLAKMGTAYPELDPTQLGRMRTIAYPATDGTEIPGYLTVPVGLRAEKLPLIVMPHGGPIARDYWDFDFLRAFLVSRGYAVLQMNFRGSSGYGNAWLYAGHQDWGGLTYSDITDGARWAVKQGIADPERMCIVGWSFGGYAALLGAVRNADLYRCSASIAGVSDLNKLLLEARFFSNNKIVREQIGANSDKLREDSPLRHVDGINMPVLLIHGDKDYQVEDNHSRSMAAALKRARKPHRAVFIENATHQLQRKSDRVTLLTELEKFLQQNIGPGATAPGP